MLGHGLGQGGLAGGVAGDHACFEPATGVDRQPVNAAAQHATDAIQRVAGAATVASCVLLDLAPDII